MRRTLANDAALAQRHDTGMVTHRREDPAGRQAVPLKSRVAHRVWRALLNGPAGTPVENALVWAGHRFPYGSWPGQGAAVGELAAKRADQTLVATVMDGVRIVVPAIPEGVGLYVKGAYGEEGTIRLFRRFWRPGQVFFDVGANMGIYTFLGAHRCGSAGQVHAFEPQRDLVACLERSAGLLRNGAATVTIVAAAVSDRHNGAGTLYYAANREGTGIPSLLAHGWLDAGSGGSVATVSIDGYRHEHRTGRIDAMKVDVEGAEMLVLQGMRQTLEQAPPDLMVLEVLPEMLSFQHIAGGTPLPHAPGAASPGAMVGFLAGYGYEPRRIRRDGRLGPCYGPRELAEIGWSTNIGFVRPAVRAARPGIFAKEA